MALIFLIFYALACLCCDFVRLCAGALSRTKKRTTREREPTKQEKPPDTLSATFCDSLSQNEILDFGELMDDDNE